MSEENTLPLPRVFKRPKIARAVVVATNKGWVATQTNSRDGDELIVESRNLYSNLESHDLLLPCDLEYAGISVDDEEGKDDQGDKVAPDSDQTDSSETTDNQEDGEGSTSESSEVETPEPVDPEVQTEEPTKTPLNELDEVNEEVLKGYKADEVIKFAEELELGEFSTKKSAVAAILELVGG